MISKIFPKMEVVRLMSSYEICMLILAAVTLVVKLIDMNDHNHKK